MVELDCQLFAQRSALAMAGGLRAVKSSQRYNDLHRVIFYPSSTLCSAGPQHCWRLNTRLNPAGVASFCCSLLCFHGRHGLHCMCNAFAMRSRGICSCYAAGQLQSAWEPGTAFAVSTLGWRLFEACSLCSQRTISQSSGLAHKWTCEFLLHLSLPSTGCGQAIMQNWEQDYWTESHNLGCLKILDLTVT